MSTRRTPAARVVGARVDAVLAEARKGAPRLRPHEVAEAVAHGALLVDTRTEAQRRRQGDLPGAVVIDRTVLEWRLDPTSPHRIPEVDRRRPARRVACRSGLQLQPRRRVVAPARLHRATDLEGGVEAWLAAGLPMTDARPHVRE